MCKKLIQCQEKVLKYEVFKSPSASIQGAKRFARFLCKYNRQRKSDTSDILGTSGKKHVMITKCLNHLNINVITPLNLLSERCSGDERDVNRLKCSQKRQAAPLNAYIGVIDNRQNYSSQPDDKEFDQVQEQLKDSHQEIADHVQKWRENLERQDTHHLFQKNHEEGEDDADNCQCFAVTTPEYRLCPEKILKINYL